MITRSIERGKTKNTPEKVYRKKNFLQKNFVKPSKSGRHKVVLNITTLSHTRISRVTEQQRQLRTIIMMATTMMMMPSLLMKVNKVSFFTLNKIILCRYIIYSATIPRSQQMHHLIPSSSFRLRRCHDDHGHVHRVIVIREKRKRVGSVPLSLCYFLT